MLGEVLVIAFLKEEVVDSEAVIRKVLSSTVGMGGGELDHQDDEVILSQACGGRGGRIASHDHRVELAL